MKDFATPSLNSCDKNTDTCMDDDGDDNHGEEEATAAEVSQLSLRRHWETRYDNVLQTNSAVMCALPLSLNKAFY